MNKIFFKNDRGQSQLMDWLENLYRHEPITYRSVSLYLTILEAQGLSAGAHYIKYLKIEKLWELRPKQNRIFFFCPQEKEFVLLHQFVKKTQKTPKREIERAIREKYYYLRTKGGL